MSIIDRHRAKRPSFIGGGGVGNGPTGGASGGGGGSQRAIPPLFVGPISPYLPVVAQGTVIFSGTTPPSPSTFAEFELDQSSLDGVDTLG